MNLHFFLPRAAITLVLACAAYWTIRLTYADHLFRSGSEANIRRAAQLVPFNHTYQARAGNLLRAVEINPYFSAAWLELASQAEDLRDFAQAERYFLQASKVDKLFEPRWSLANFYFRRGNQPEFWKWIRLAAEMSYGDRSAIFRLCWRMTDRPRQILDALPSNGSLLADYLQFLISQNNWDAAIDAAPRALAHASPTDQPALMSLCEKLLEAGRPIDAAVVWNGMIARRWLPYAALDPANGPWLTNAVLESPPLGKGFDWRLLWRAGVHSTWIGPERGLRIELSGKQNEQTDLLSQFLPATGAGRYSFRFRYRTNNIPPGSGLHWSVENPAGAPLAQSTDLASEDWRPAIFDFDLPKTPQLLRITLIYTRQSGTMRPAGVFWLDNGMELRRISPPVARSR